jgi:hypothetical protein
MTNAPPYVRHFVRAPLYFNVRHVLPVVSCSDARGEPELAWSLSISLESIMTPKGATFWRKAGLNYLQYLNIATRTVRAGLKVWSVLSVIEIGLLYRVIVCTLQEPLRTNAQMRETVFYNKAGRDGLKGMACTARKSLTMSDCPCSFPALQCR